MAKKSPGYHPDGRSKKNKHFTGVPDSVWDHPNFQRLSSKAKVVIFAITRRNFGRNNGNIAFSVRDGEKYNLGRDATANALREAEQAGFIYATKRGSFTSKRLATEWAVSWQSVGGNPATHAYRNTEPKIKPSLSNRTRQSVVPDTSDTRAHLQSA